MASSRYTAKVIITFVELNTPPLCVLYKVIINNCPIAVGVGDVVECTASLITWVRLVSPVGGDTGGSFYRRKSVY
jgi:hypothetical protein